MRGKKRRTRICKCPDGDAELREGGGSRGAWRVIALQLLSHGTVQSGPSFTEDLRGEWC